MKRTSEWIDEKSTTNMKVQLTMKKHAIIFSSDRQQSKPIKQKKIRDLSSV